MLDSNVAQFAIAFAPAKPRAAHIEIELSEIVSVRCGRNRVEKFHVTDASAFYIDRAGHRCRGEFVVVTGPMKIAGSCAGKAAVPGFGHPLVNG